MILKIKYNDERIDLIEIKDFAEITLWSTSESIKMYNEMAEDSNTDLLPDDANLKAITIAGLGSARYIHEGESADVLVDSGNSIMSIAV